MDVSTWVVVLDGLHSGGTAIYLSKLERGKRWHVRSLDSAARFDTKRDAQQALAHHKAPFDYLNAHLVQFTGGGYIEHSPRGGNVAGPTRGGYVEPAAELGQTAAQQLEWVVVLDGQHSTGTATYLGVAPHGPRGRRRVQKLEDAGRFTTRLAARRWLQAHDKFRIHYANAHLLQLTPGTNGAYVEHPAELGRSYRSTHAMKKTKAHAMKKTNAQLDREIAEFIDRSRRAPRRRG